MRKSGTPITIRVDADVLKLATREAKRLKKPLCTHLREIIERSYRTIVIHSHERFVLPTEFQPKDKR